MEPKDYQAARIALEKGMISEARVQECMKLHMDEVREGRKPRPIAGMMVEERYITADQYAELMEEMRRLVRERVEDYKPIGELLVESGALEPSKLKGALTEQSHHPGRRVGEILLENGWVTYAQILEVLKIQEKTVLVCPSCRARYNVVRYRAGEGYDCRRCRGRLVDPSKTDMGSLPADPSTRRLPAVGGPEETTRVVARPHELAAPEPPPTLGAYLILGDAFEGDFGTVYRAWRRDGGDSGASTFLFFLEGGEKKTVVDGLFTRIRARALESNITIKRLLDVQEHDGKRFMAMR